LDMYFGVLPYTTLHPWVCTHAFGLLMSLGRRLGDNVGVFCITATFAVIEAFCYGKACQYMKRWPLGRMADKIWIFFAFYPAFMVYAQSVVKDGPYIAFFTLFFTLLADTALSSGKKAGARRYASLFFLALLICLFRRNGAFIALPALLFFALWEKGRRRLIPIMGAFLVFALFWGTGRVGDSLGIERASARAILTIPFQQTARIARDFPEDISKEEREAIEGVLPYKKLASRYQEDLSDPIKNLYKEEAGAKEITAFLQTWAHLCLRHPLSSLEAFLAGSFGYLYPFYHFETLDALDLAMSRHPSVDLGAFDISYFFGERIRFLFDGYVRLWEKVPVLSLSFHPAFYTWLLLFLAGYLLSRRRAKGILFLLPAAISVAVCLSSPVNGYLRYALPLAASSPALCGFTYLYGAKEHGKKKEAGKERHGGEGKAKRSQMKP
ncbi:MAG: hypothetical protein IIZ39_03240, partial [Blautia sp.]|nr:hypothetical protein [Blautia sp.]